MEENEKTHPKEKEKSVIDNDFLDGSLDKATFGRSGIEIDMEHMIPVNTVPIDYQKNN